MNKYQEALDELDRMAYGDCMGDEHIARIHSRKILQELVDKETLNENVKQWAIERGLDKASPINQMLKLTEEVGELASAIAKDKQEEIKDALGDIQVVLTVLSLQLGYPLDKCLEQAYNEIKERKGHMINGTFVKDSDMVLNKK